jgi:NAD(P)-dependent dehydrogenase (short-subunit alcohol dehydrogenase family)
LEDNKAFANRLTDSHPISRIARASEIADAVIWLCSERSTYLVGAALPLDGGCTAR